MNVDCDINNFLNRHCHYMSCVPRKCAFKSLSMSAKGWGPTNPSLCMTPTIKCTLLLSRMIFCSRCHTKRRIDRAPACQSFFGYDNDKDLKDSFPVTQLIFASCILVDVTEEYDPVQSPVLACATLGMNDLTSVNC